MSGRVRNMIKPGRRRTNFSTVRITRFGRKEGYVPSRFTLAALILHTDTDVYMHTNDRALRVHGSWASIFNKATRPHPPTAYFSIFWNAPFHPVWAFPRYPSATSHTFGFYFTIRALSIPARSLLSPSHIFSKRIKNKSRSCNRARSSKSFTSEFLQKEISLT